MLSYHKRTLAKVAVFVPLALIAAWFAIAGVGLVSHTATTRIGVHSLLSYWASIPAAAGLLVYWKNPSRSLAAFIAALLFPIVVNLGSAIVYLSDLTTGPVVKGIPNLVSDIYEYAVFGVLVLVALYIQNDSENAKSKSEHGVLQISLSILIAGIIFWFMWYMLFPSMSSLMLISLGISTAIAAIIVLCIATYRLIRYRYEELPIDVGYFVSASILTIIAISLNVLDLFLLSTFWIYAETLQIASLFLITISICVPFLRRNGFVRRTAYSLIVSLAVLTYVPFILTISIEAAFMHDILLPINELAFSVIHIGVGSLSGMMGILLFAFARKRPSRHQFPLILLFVLWAAVAAVSVLVIILPDFASLGEPVVSYIVGSMLSLVLLFFAIRWTPIHPEKEPTSPSSVWLSLGVIAVFSLVTIGEIVNQLVLQQYIWLAGNPISKILLLGTNLLLIFAIAYLLLIQAELSQGRLSMESYVVLFLSMWIVPNILKSYYSNWTVAWWASELLIFIGLLAGPAFMGILYIRAMREAEDSHSKAGLYADLLMHDISNYHQMLLTSVELLGEEVATTTQRERLSNDAYHVISLAEQLITNVRLITESESLSHATLEPLNLMDTLVGALDRVMRVAGGKGVKLQLMPFSAQAHVLGSSVLKHVFINIVHSVLLQPIAEQKIVVEISSISELGAEYWQIRLFIPGWWAEVQEPATALPRTEEDFSGSALGILVSRLVTESLGGRLTVLRNLEEPGMGTSFIVTLPAFQKPD